MKNEQVMNMDVENTNEYEISAEEREKYIQELGVTKCALENFFRILRQRQTPKYDLDNKLREIAERYKTFLDKGKLLEASEDIEIQGYLYQARQFIEGQANPDNDCDINFAKADELLQQAFEQAQASIKQLSEVEQKPKTAREKKQMSAAKIMQQKAALAQAQLKYIQAGEYYQQAAGLLPEEKEKAYYLHEAGKNFYYAGLYKQALPLQQQTLMLRKQVLGEQHPDYAKSLNNLAILYCAQGQYEQALPLYQQAADIWEQTLGKQHSDYAKSLANIGELYRVQGKYEQALLLHQQALEIREQILGKQHSDYAQSLNNIALIYHAQGQYEQALPLFQQALEIQEQILGKQHPDYANTLNNLAILYFSQGQHKPALPLYQQAADIYEQTLGKQHPDYVASINNLATLYFAQGQFKKALPLHKKAVDLFTVTLGKQHPTTKKARKFHLFFVFISKPIIWIQTLLSFFKKN